MGKYLSFYKECMKTERMPEKGLCKSLGDEVDVFSPTYKDFCNISYQDYSSMFWASGLSRYDMDKHYTFTPLRQTIVLFLAAMNNEL